MQKLSASFFQKFRRVGALLGKRLKSSPRLSAWFYFAEEELSSEESYRRFNESYFADLHTQERMLADQPRMAFYHEMIRRSIKKGDRVIDLGTGTGILAAFSSRQGADQVYALDHSSIIEHAKQLAKENEISNVHFENIHSSQFHLDEPVDVIVHEQMGDYLFDEAMLANVCDLRDRVLKPGGMILPSCFELFCEPVTLRDERRVPFLWELDDVHGFDFSSMEGSRPQDVDYYSLVSCDLGVVKHFVTEPAPILKVDLHHVSEGKLPLRVKFTRKVIRPGILDGLVIYMKAKVGDDLELSSSPLDPGRAPHWGYRILRLDQSEVEVGTELEVTLTVEDWSNPDTWEWYCGQWGSD